MVEVLISLPPSGKDMRDGLVTLPSLGQTAGRQCNRSFKVRNICLPIYYSTGAAALSTLF